MNSRPAPAVAARPAAPVQPVYLAAARCLESLESRTLMAVGLDRDGFTVVTPSNDTKTIYVSASEGSDQNSGLSSDAPVKTLAKGVSLLRSGSPDHLLLKRGDEWNESFTNWTKSGKNANEPMLIGGYGSGDRPHIKAGAKHGFFSNKAFNDVAILGLEFEANTRNPESPDFSSQAGGYGIQIVGPVNGLLVEDSDIHHFAYNVSVTGFSGYAKNVTLRRNAITDAYDNVKSQGIYASMTDGLTLDGNVIDHNGWNEKLGVEATIYSHNIYFWANTRNTTVRNNIIADAASHGIQARGGGIIENNLFVRNPIHALLGNGSTVLAGGVTGRVSGNIFLESRAIGTNTRGWAIEVGNIRAGAGADVRDNIIAHDTQNRFAAIKLDPPTGATNIGEAVGINDLTVERNIVYKWHQGLSIHSGLVSGGAGAMAVNNLVVRDNDFQQTSSARIINHGNGFKAAEETWDGNSYYHAASMNSWFALQGGLTSFTSWQDKLEGSARAEQLKYPDPNRSVGSYNASIGGANSRDAFLDRAADNSKARWNPYLTAQGAIDYLRAGFTGVTPNGPSTPGPSTPPPATPVPAPSQPDRPGTGPTATLAAEDRTTAGATPHQFKVTYTDDTAVQVSSIGSGDIRVTGPNGFSQNATFVKADKLTDGATRTATYEVAAPGGAWDGGDAGVYTVRLNAAGVRDVDGVYAPPATLGTFAAAITGGKDDGATPPAGGAGDATPPAVLWSNFDPASQTIMVKFSEDVSGSLNASDIRLKNKATNELIPNSALKLTYDAITHTATWSFDGNIEVATYKVMLGWSVVNDAVGNKLDGNHDGVAGDDHVMQITAAEIAAIAVIAASDPLAPKMGN